MNLLEGSKLLEENVACTLGPRGQNVILKPVNQKPFITKDGVTVARFVELEDPVQDIAAQVLKQASVETVKQAGDGTTTSTVLAHAIFGESVKYVLSGVPPIIIKRGLEKASRKAVEKIKEHSTPIKSKEDVCNIATISANNDDSIGSLIADAIESIGRDGAIVVDESKSIDTILDLVEGFRIDRGFVSQHFVNDEMRNAAVYKEPLFFITDHHISDVDSLLPVLEIALRAKKALVIIAEEVADEALAACIYNAIQAKKNLVNAVKVAIVKPPKYGEERTRIMEDMAIAVGARFVSMASGDSLDDVSLADLGTAAKVEIGRQFTTIIGGGGNQTEIDNRIASLKHQVQELDHEEGSRIQERITRLAAGIAIIKVGGTTDVEVKEKKDRIEDALEAVDSARVEGIVAGGGTTLLYVANDLEKEYGDLSADDLIGFRILVEAMKAPFKRIAKNSDISWQVCYNKLQEYQNPEMGIDFRNGNVLNMKECGIIDPAKVTRVALENAVSAASTLITTNNAIIETED